MVRKGRIVEETPEYQSFKRLADTRMDRVRPHLNLLLEVIKKLDVKLIRVNGAQLLSYSLTHAKPTIQGVSGLLLPADSD